MALPLINVLNFIYDRPKITWPISKKCRQAAPLYIDQPGINSIYITEQDDGLSEFERKWIKKDFDLLIEPSPQHPKEQDWYNYRSCVEETMLMAGAEYYDVYKNLGSSSQIPRLNNWWDDSNQVNEKTIAIHSTAGYGQGKNRSPSTDWWRPLCLELLKRGYKVKQFGHSNDEDISSSQWECTGIFKRYNDYSLFEQIQLAAKCEYYIGTDSGFSWIMGALGAKQISLITNWLPNHYTNPLALTPLNCASNSTNLFAENGCDNININKVLELL